MKAKLQYLRPYKSLILAQLPSAKQSANGVVAAIIEDLVLALKLDGKDPSLTLIQKPAPTSLAGDTEVGFIQFTQTQTPAWTSEVGITDTLNHLVLVLRHKRALAIFVSDPSFRAAVFNRMDDPASLGLSDLELIPRARLNAAFVQGKTRTLWLSGVHRRTSIKADSKVLAGADLKDALNPLDDQTYNFTAARSAAKVANKDVTVGAVPRQSRIWVGSSRSWTDFWESTVALLAHLQNTTTDENAPLPVLARTVANVGNVSGAFDVSLLPPELLVDDQSGQGTRAQQVEKWAYKAYFEIKKSKGADFKAELTLEDQLIGEIEFTVDVSNPENVLVAAKGALLIPGAKADFEEALRLCNHPRWITIRYESGHTVSDGALIELAHRDIPFQGFEWVDFADYKVKREKPKPLSKTGQQKSLFCWVQNHWPVVNGKSGKGGWLACDDGAGEIADFIHLDTSGPVPLVSLIHVKGAGSPKPNREISVSKYEVVTGQAVKNLRSTDRALLSEGLHGGLHKKVGRLVWHDRKPSTRAKFLDELSKIGANYRREVVIVQPHVTKKRHTAATNNPASADAARLRQLDTLLVGAELNCRALNAGLRVIVAK